MSKKNIAVDFDGVIHRYSKGWSDGSIYDSPMAGVLEALRELQIGGFDIIIFSTRAVTQKGKREIWSWLKENNLRDYVSDVMGEKPQALYYLDDHGIRFENWEWALKSIYKLEVERLNE